MRVVFFGTPDVAVPGLEALIASEHDVACVVTQPDRPRGRGREVSPSPVKALADRNGIPVLQPPTPKADGFADALRVFEPNALAVIAYGHLLPQDVLAVAPAVNVHFSLLPRYRGAAPVQRALMDGVTETGVSVFLLEPTMDTGPILASQRVPVGPDDTTGDLFDRLVPVGTALLLRALEMLAGGVYDPEPQEDELASPAPKIKPEEARIDWSLPAERIRDLVRALNPRPGAYTTFRGKRLTVWRAGAADGRGDPGTVLDPETFTVATGDGALALTQVQPEGKKRMTGDEFARGYRPLHGERLGGSE